MFVKVFRHIYKTIAIPTVTFLNESSSFFLRMVLKWFYNFITTDTCLVYTRRIYGARIKIKTIVKVIWKVEERTFEAVKEKIKLVSVCGNTWMLLCPSTL